MDCEAIAKEECEGNHSILDPKEDVKEIKALLTELSKHSSKAVEKRQQIDDFLRAAIDTNGMGLAKLRSLSGVKQLLAGSKTGAASAKKKLEEALKQRKGEVEEADRMWSDLNGHIQANVSCIAPSI